METLPFLEQRPQRARSEGEETAAAVRVRGCTAPHPNPFWGQAVLVGDDRPQQSRAAAVEGRRRRRGQQPQLSPLKGERGPQASLAGL